MHRFNAVTAQAIGLSDFLQETFFDNYSNAENVIIVTKEFLTDYLFRQLSGIMADATRELEQKHYSDFAMMMNTVEILTKDVMKVGDTKAEHIMFDDDQTFIPKPIKP